MLWLWLATMSVFFLLKKRLHWITINKWRALFLNGLLFPCVNNQLLAHSAGSPSLSLQSLAVAAPALSMSMFKEPLASLFEGGPCSLLASPLPMMWVQSSLTSSFQIQLLWKGKRGRHTVRAPLWPMAPVSPWVKIHPCRVSLCRKHCPVAKCYPQMREGMWNSPGRENEQGRAIGRLKYFYEASPLHKQQADYKAPFFIFQCRRVAYWWNSFLVLLMFI